MLRTGNQLRLTRPERARLARITAIEPGSIRSVADLQAYVRRCKAHYWGHSDDTRFLHWLIEREVQALFAVSEAGTPPVLDRGRGR